MTINFASNGLLLGLIPFPQEGLQRKILRRPTVSGLSTLENPRWSIKKTEF
jgi:hypothetical protein